jgi:4-amino-4-deoxy-L-arabinose transferase-like glycosyltransferase
MKGISIGFAMLARPDAAFLVLIVLVVEAIRVYRNQRKQELIPVIAGLVTIYAPWLIFTTLYYGSPIPNTIIAKGLGYSNSWSHSPWQILDRLKAVPLQIFATLGPVYGGHGTGFLPLWDHHQIIAQTMLLFVLVGAVVAAKRRHVQALALFAYVLIYGAYLMFAVSIVFGWYTVPIVAGAVIAAAYGFWAIVSHIQSEHVRQRVLAVCGAAYILSLAASLPFTVHSDKYVQKDIDSGVREQMGIYLGQVSLPTDTIASESLGYVGYYSGRVIYDYPGLCSRRVVQYLRDYPSERYMIGMMYHLQPTYIVLRPKEFMKDGRVTLPWITQDYDLVKVFQAPPETDQQILFPDKNIDKVFYVYRHKGAPSRSAPPA